MFGNDSKKLTLQWLESSRKQIKFRRECLLPFSLESLIFLSHT